MTSNVNKFFYMRDDESGNRTQSFAEFAAEFHFEPSGVNDYYGVVQAQVDRIAAGGKALGKSHQDLFEMVLHRLNDPLLGCTEKTVNLIIEPSQAAVPEKAIRPTYDFVRDNRRLIEALAGELHDFQQRAATGRTLHVAICYGQEMNSSDTAWGPPRQGSPRKQVRDFVETYKLVRDVFRITAPNIAFAFSPGLRADRTLPGITAYWPDTKFGKGVDIVGGTWYVHAPSQFDAAARLLRNYVAYFAHAHKPFVLDEMGGAGGTTTPPVYNENDTYLLRMLEVVAGLGVPLDYITLFLNRDRWGSDATLHFLRPGQKAPTTPGKRTTTSKPLAGAKTP